MNQDARPTHIDLFSGIGGFALAAAWAGFDTVAFCDIEPYCQALLKERCGAVLADAELHGRNHTKTGSVEDNSQGTLGSNHEHRQIIRGGPTIWPDIRQLDGRLYAGAALLTGGFPCQPFSVAGKRRGKEDDRFLWPEMLRVIDQARPAWVLGENVPGIIAMELDRGLSDLEGIGYTCWPLVIPACAVDAKHRRDRVWIVGYSGRSSSGTGLCQVGEKQDGTQSGNASCTLADAKCIRSLPRWNDAGQSTFAQPVNCSKSWCQWLPEPAVGRVANGIPRRVDRLRALGNAVVPQQAYILFREIARIEGIGQ